MAALNHRSFYDERIFNKTFLMEMNAAASNVKKNLSAKAEISHQTDTPCIQVQGLNSNQGSVLSLATRSIIDQSDDQPLTDIHVCRFDECNKFHSQSNKDSAENPASFLKNFYLFLLIALLILWIIIYTILVQFKVL